MSRRFGYTRFEDPDVADEHPGTGMSIYGSTGGGYEAQADRQRREQRQLLHRQVAGLLVVTDQLTVECIRVDEDIRNLPNWEGDATLAEQKQRILQQPPLPADSLRWNMIPELLPHRDTLLRITVHLSDALHRAREVRWLLSEVRNNPEYVPPQTPDEGDPVYDAEGALATLEELVTGSLPYEETLSHVLRNYLRNVRI